MSETPLRDGVRRLLETARNEEWTFTRALTADERDRIGTEGAPEIKELVVRATAGRRHATSMLREVAAGRSADGCIEPPPGPVGTWAEAHHDAHNATAELLGALDAVDEEQLAANPGPRSAASRGTSRGLMAKIRSARRRARRAALTHGRKAVLRLLVETAVSTRT